MKKKKKKREKRKQFKEIPYMRWNGLRDSWSSKQVFLSLFYLKQKESKTNKLDETKNRKIKGWGIPSPWLL